MGLWGSPTYPAAHKGVVVLAEIVLDADMLVALVAVASLAGTMFTANKVNKKKEDDAAAALVQAETEARVQFFKDWADGLTRCHSECEALRSKVAHLETKMEKLEDENRRLRLKLERNEMQLD